MKNMTDLIGIRSGRLLVIEKDLEKSDGKVIFWKCKCDCGNDVIVAGSELKKGSTKSCGCLRKELAKNRLKKHNKYDLDTYDYGIGYTNKNEEFYFSKEDYHLIKDYCWFINNTGYLYAKDINNPKKHILMHRLILSDAFQVDHINHIRYDNRRENIRPVNNSENNMNKSAQSNNKTGCPGVIWHKRDNIWEVYINKNNKRYYLGRYENFDEAVKLRKKAEQEFFGEYGYDNSQEHAYANPL